MYDPFSVEVSHSPVIRRTGHDAKDAELLVRLSGRIRATRMSLYVPVTGRSRRRDRAAKGMKIEEVQRGMQRKDVSPRTPNASVCLGPRQDI